VCGGGGEGGRLGSVSIPVARRARTGYHDGHLGQARPGSPRPPPASGRCWSVSRTRSGQACQPVQTARGPDLSAGAARAVSSTPLGPTATDRPPPDRRRPGVTVRDMRFRSGAGRPDSDVLARAVTRVATEVPVEERLGPSQGTSRRGQGGLRAGAARGRADIRDTLCAFRVAGGRWKDLPPRQAASSCRFPARISGGTDDQTQGMRDCGTAVRPAAVPPWFRRGRCRRADMRRYRPGRDARAQARGHHGPAQARGAEAQDQAPGYCQSTGRSPEQVPPRERRPAAVGQAWAGQFDQGNPSHAPRWASGTAWAGQGPGFVG
jgi:hypothetical protein